MKAKIGKHIPISPLIVSALLDEARDGEGSRVRG